MRATQTFAVVDSSGSWCDVSPDLARLLGASEGGHPSGDLFSVVHPDSHPLLRDVICEASCSPRSFGCQFALATGVTFWTYVGLVRREVCGEDRTSQRIHLEFTTPMPAATPSPERLAATIAAIAANDVRRNEREQAARRRAEAAWRHLREIVHQAPIMMATAEGPDHVFTTANRRYLETFGVRDIVGKTIREVFPEAEAQGFIAILDEVYRSGEPFVADGLTMDLQVNGDLTRFYFNLVYQAIRDGDGTVTGILANVADVTSLFRANEALSTANTELREAYDQTIHSWGRALDIWDHDTAGHSERVTELAVRLATQLGMEGDDLVHLRWGAQLHDIGKMAVPERIIQKPGALDPDEWVLMKSHTTQGAAFLEPIAYLRPAIEIPLHHHERWDGTGYPHGLAGEAIPLAARIFAVVDVFDALTSDRPYRTAWTRERTLDHIRDGAGTHFDPDVVRAFLESTNGEGAPARGT